MIGGAAVGGDGAAEGERRRLVLDEGPRRGDRPVREDEAVRHQGGFPFHLTVAPLQGAVALRFTTVLRRT